MANQSGQIITRIPELSFAEAPVRKQIGKEPPPPPTIADSVAERLEAIIAAIRNLDGDYRQSEE